MGLDNGDMLIIGGRIGSLSTGYDTNEIWRKSAIDGTVSRAGTLQKVVLTTIMILIYF